MGWSEQCFISDRKEGWGEGRKEGKGEEKEKRKGKEGRKEGKEEGKRRRKKRERERILIWPSFPNRVWGQTTALISPLIFLPEAGNILPRDDQK